MSDAEIAAAALADWRKLRQGLYARYRVDDFGAGARFVVAVGEERYAARVRCRGRAEADARRGRELYCTGVEEWSLELWPR